MLIARLLMAAVLASALFGQSNVGEISGQVSDSTGAAILGCVVTATHTQTGLKRTILTRAWSRLTVSGKSFDCLPSLSRRGCLRPARNLRSSARIPSLFPATGRHRSHTIERHRW